MSPDRLRSLWLQRNWRFPASLESCVPVIYGVLTCNTVEQAIERAGLKSGNKGFDAAMAAVEMVQVLKQL